MRYSAPLSIAAAALAAGLTVVAVRALGPGVEAHPVTRVAAAHLGWMGYLSLSILVLAVGLRLLSVLPFAEWGARVIAVAKVVDATRDAWLVAHHPAVRVDAIGEALPTLVAIVAATALALYLVRNMPAPRRPVDPEAAV